MHSMVPRRITGFMEYARKIVTQSPELTAQEVYQKAESLAKATGKKLSAAANPEGSLVATLHKHHRQYGLERRRVGGRYVFYASQPPMPPSQVMRSVHNCCMELPEEDKKRVNALVDLKSYPSINAAYVELIRIGLDTVIKRL